MVWHDLVDLSADDVVIEDDMDEIRENIEHLGSMTFDGTPLSAHAEGKEIGWGYISEWFAVGAGNTYTKAHGLPYTPSVVEVWHSTTATPSAGDELVRVTVVKDASGASFFDVAGADGTNIYITTGTDGSWGTVSSSRRFSAGGFYKVYAR
jgi:hypothetical protein